MAQCSVAKYTIRQLLGAIGTLMSANEHSLDQIALTLMFSAPHDERWVYESQE
jgi:hypothetical protein